MQCDLFNPDAEVMFVLARFFRKMNNDESLNKFVQMKRKLYYYLSTLGKVRVIK